MTREAIIFFAMGVALAGCSKPCMSKMGVESKPAGARIFLRTEADVTFSAVYGVTGTKQDKTAATPDNVQFLWSDDALKKIWIKVIWEDETESEPIQVWRCENVRIVFPREGSPTKMKVRVKTDDDARLETLPAGAVSVTAGDCHTDEG